MESYSLVKQRFIDYINNIITNSKVSHAYLIEVDNYDSDFNYILVFIKMILCNIAYEDLENYSNNIVNQVDTYNYPDLKIISPDGNTIKKAQLLDLMSDFNNKSLLDNKRIYIIKEAEKLNQSSANTILKFLEEPEDDIIAFLVTNNRYSIIDTILSRCQVLSLKENIFSTIDNIDGDSNFIDFIDCVLNPKNFFIKYNYIINNYLPDKNFCRDKFIEVENIILSYLDDNHSIVKLDNENIELIFSKYDMNYLVNIVSIIEDYLKKLDYNVNYKLWVDSLFASLIGGNVWK